MDELRAFLRPFLFDHSVVIYVDCFSVVINCNS